MTAVGKNVDKFKVGDRAGVGCMVDSCLECESCKDDGEPCCPETVFTYGYPEKSSPTGISRSVAYVFWITVLLRPPQSAACGAR